MHHKDMFIALNKIDATGLLQKMHAKKVNSFQHVD
jgi:hypothetical protein